MSKLTAIATELQASRKPKCLGCGLVATLADDPAAKKEHEAEALNAMLADDNWSGPQIIKCVTQLLAEHYPHINVRVPSSSTLNVHRRKCGQ